MTTYASTRREYDAIISSIEEFDDKVKGILSILYPPSHFVGADGKPILPDVRGVENREIYRTMLTKIADAVRAAQKEYAYARYVFDRADN